MSTLAGSPYSIARSTGVCAATGHAIQTGDAFVAALVERPGQPALERLDFSREAWEAGARPSAPLRLFGSWRSVRQSAEGVKKPLLSDAELLDLFEELAAAGEAIDPKRQGFRYLLALLLVRRRVLKLEPSPSRILRVRPKSQQNQDQGPIVEIKDPGMGDAAIADAIEQLGAILATDAPDGAHA